MDIGTAKDMIEDMHHEINALRRSLNTLTRVAEKAYNRGDYDNFNQRNRNKTGIGITFQQDFDNIYDLLRIKRKQNSIKEAEKNAAKKEEDLSPVSK